ncbi:MULTISPECIES: Uma2 family endonuclease [unclassified Coleofasciculus]|uniref:Uma2 family endonuclease n=1 Tax=Cyanophyceae TaxID=3028117 RepID=UPI0016879332|nr:MULTISPECIES: Uma2 family endonuclease [unclassified Coleofasciculus]MBD2084442.1 Uma2 family endonuclease [Coleofasciculus sp. FACHB-542]MBD2541860.1 Uma2 family endonuclease [Coleofasciculus sp. FACHB-SPT36]
MLEYKPPKYFPSSEELPDSDETPVDNELQDLIPGLLKAILAMAWADRMDWFFGVDMGIYYDPDKPAIVPDGFLSLGVERFFDEELRLSYAIWEEERVPTMVLEVVSQTYRKEYSQKKLDYANLGVLYYVIYSSRRRRKPHLEVHRLVDGEYVLQPGNPVWLPEMGLAIGTERGIYQGITREWLYWYDEQGQRLLTPEERAQLAEQNAQLAEQRAQLAEQRAQTLAKQLRAMGLDPDSLG